MHLWKWLLGLFLFLCVWTLLAYLFSIPQWLEILVGIIGFGLFLSAGIIALRGEGCDETYIQAPCPP